MGNFKRKDKFGAGKKFGRAGDKSFGKKKDRADRPAMFQAICSECGKKCELPFKPSGNRPVFCSECFGQKDSLNRGKLEINNDNPAAYADRKMSAITSTESYKKDFELLNSKLDDILTMLAEVIMNRNDKDTDDFEEVEAFEDIEVIDMDKEIEEQPKKTAAKSKAKGKPKAEKPAMAKKTSKKAALKKKSK